MRSLLRAMVVMVTVTVAGTALPSMAGPTGPATLAASGTLDAERATTPTPTEAAIRRARSGRTQPLRSITIALDPGHQLGNHNYPRQTSALVPAGGFKKPCNTTGTATNSGVAETTVNFRLARAVRQRLQALGARVRMTRNTNSQSRWGPCVNARGRFGKRVGARLMVSLHADGASSSGRGFHVIAPKRRAPWTTDIAGPSLRLARSLRDGLTAYGVPRSNYTGGGHGLNVRSDLGTLNLSDVPVAMIEIGNMRNSGDARRMTSASGRARYSNAVVRGIRSFLRR